MSGLFNLLPLEVVFEIWRRLTLKDLLRLRRVSVQSKTLIDSNIRLLVQYFLPKIIYRDMMIAASSQPVQKIYDSLRRYYELSPVKPEKCDPFIKTVLDERPRPFIRINMHKDLVPVNRHVAQVRDALPGDVWTFDVEISEPRDLAQVGLEVKCKCGLAKRCGVDLFLHGWGEIYHTSGTDNDFENDWFSSSPLLRRWYETEIANSVMHPPPPSPIERPTYKVLCTLYYNYQSELHLTVEIPTQSPIAIRLDQHWYWELHKNVSCPTRQFRLYFRDYWGPVRLLQNSAQ